MDVLVRTAIGANENNAFSVQYRWEMRTGDTRYAETAGMGSVAYAMPNKLNRRRLRMYLALEIKPSACIYLASLGTASGAGGGTTTEDVHKQR